MVAMDQMPAASARTRHRSLRSAQYPQTGANKDPVKLCTMSTAPWRKGDKPISTSSARKELASPALQALQLGLTRALPLLVLVGQASSLADEWRRLRHRHLGRAAAAHRARARAQQDARAIRGSTHHP